MKHKLVIVLSMLAALIQATCFAEKSEIQVIQTTDYDLVKGFFKDFHIYETFLQSILENKNAGKVFIDDFQHPSFALVCIPSAPQTLADIYF